MKRSLLPLNALRVFDAAARHLSFTKAADELSVTPAAVGQQIRQLEEVLGAVLFRRLTRNLELTPEAERALPALREGFRHIEAAVDAIQQGQGDRIVTIGAPRDFISKWLAPRLVALGAGAPGQRFILLPLGGPPDFAAANMDLAVQFGPLPAEEDLSGTRIAAEEIVIVAAPDMAAKVRLPRDLTALALVHHPSTSWGKWFAEAGVTHPEIDGGLSVADAGLAVDAAAAGYGIARVPRTIAAADIEAGRVTALFDAKPSDEAYWLVAPPWQWRQKKVKALVAGLTG